MCIVVPVGFMVEFRFAKGEVVALSLLPGVVELLSRCVVFVDKDASSFAPSCFDEEDWEIPTQITKAASIGRTINTRIPSVFLRDCLFAPSLLLVLSLVATCSFSCPCSSEGKRQAG